MTTKTNQNQLRQMLLKDGKIKASTAPSAFRSDNKKVSQNNAIAARRAELSKNGKTTGDKHGNS